MALPGRMAATMEGMPGAQAVVRTAPADAAPAVGGPPMYAQLCALFRQRIARGEWLLQQRIPALDALMAEFQVARATVRHAIGLLEAEGLVRRHRGRGTFIVAKPQATIVYRIPPTWQDLLCSRTDVEFEWLDNRVADAAPLPSHAIGALAADYRFMRRRLLRHRVPYGIGETYMAAAAYAAIGERGACEPFPLRALHERLPQGMGRAEQTVRAGLVDLRTAGWLELRAGDPVLLIARSATDACGTLVYESLGIFRGDFVEMHMPLLAP